MTDTVKIYRKGDDVRRALGPADAVQLEFDGYTLDEAPAEKATDTNDGTDEPRPSVAAPRPTAPKQVQK